MKSLKLTPGIICAGSIGLACLALLFGDCPILEFFQRLEWISYDWRLRVAHRLEPPMSSKLGLVFMSDDSLAVFSQGKLGTNFQFGLKWPRHLYGRLVRELNAQGATAIGLDLLFNDHRVDHLPIQTAEGTIPSDLFFRQQLSNRGNVLLGATEEVVPDAFFQTAPSQWGEVSHELDSDGVLRRDRAFRDYRLWHPLISHEALLRGWDLQNALVLSNQIVFPRKGEEARAFVLSLNPDGYFDPTEVGTKPKDGLVRLYKPFQEGRVWHLGIALAARQLNLDLDTAVLDSKKNQIILSGTNGLQRIIPINRHGEFLIDWTITLKDKRLTAEAFESMVSKDILRQLGSNVVEQFSGKVVVVGSTATGNDLSDRGPTPLEKDTFLTTNYLNVANSLLTGRFIRQTPLWLNLLLIGLMGLAGAGFTWKLPAIWASGLVVVLTAGMVLLEMSIFLRHRWWLPMVVPALSLLLTHFGLLTYQTLFEQNERRRIKDIFSKLVSPNVVNELLQAERLSLIGAREQVTVFFADIRGFTEVTDRCHARAEEYVRANELGRAEAKVYFDQQAQVMLHTVNLYLSLVADVIKKHQGTLDKYIGDCVMAFWGAPTPNEQHALECVGAAIDAQRAIDELNQQRALINEAREAENRNRVANGQCPLPPFELLKLGIGINTGVVTVGLMGSDVHGLNYTIFGRDVNLASRLEGFSGPGRIVISEGTYLELLRLAPFIADRCVALPPRKFKGFETGPVQIFEVMWNNNWRLEEREDSSSSTTELILSSAVAR